MIRNFLFGGNYFARGEFVLYINHSGKYIEINFNMKIPYILTMKEHVCKSNDFGNLKIGL